MKKGIGIKWKVGIITVLVMSLLTVIIAVIGYVQFNENVLKSYIKYAEFAVKSENTVFEDYHMGDMIAKREMGEEYELARLELNDIKNNADIKYLYAVYFEDISDIHSICYAINGKSDEELSTGEPVEEIYSYMGEKAGPDDFDDAYLNVYRQCVLEKITEPSYHESDTPQYGHLISCYRAIIDSAGNAVGVAGADIDVNEINRDLEAYLKTVAIAAILFAVILIITMMLFINSYITDPVAAIVGSTNNFVNLMNENVAPEKLTFEKPEVKTRDEIFTLSEDVTSLAEGVRNYMANLQTVTAEKERIGAELSVATQIQASQLPNIFPPFPERTEFDIFASMTPAKEVGGDFYDFFLIDDDHIALVIADVSGKGVPAALFMMISRILIKNRIQSGEGPGEALANANNQLCEGNDAGFFVTVWLSVLEISTGKGKAANAGHEHPVLRRSGGLYELVKYRHSMAVGTMEDIPFAEHEFELNPGDSVFVYTDGVAEATDSANELFGTDRMLDALNRNPDAEPEEVLKNVMNGINEFVAGAEQFDDITMLCLKYNGRGIGELSD